MKSRMLLFAVWCLLASGCFRLATAQDINLDTPPSYYAPPLPPALIDDASDKSTPSQEAKSSIKPISEVNSEFILNEAEILVEGGKEAAPCDQCQSGVCDCAKLKSLNKAVATSHKGLFYNNNFNYLCDDCYTDWWPGDNLKRRCIGDWATLDVGGQYRARFHSEQNMRNLGLTGNDDDFLLHRTRLYANMEVGDRFRAYAEYIDAVSNYENFAPRPIDENRSDILNLFADVKLYDDCCGQLWGRVGRQELLYGAQRTVSPLDWANTRRTFEGYKLFWQGENWDIDGFWVRPVPVNAAQFDSPDQSQEFSGIYGTYKGFENETVDLYYLRYLETNGATNFEFDTLGARWAGNSGPWLWEAEGAYQWGNFGAANHSAGFFTVGMGHKFECACWQPTLWVYYDWASGDPVQGNGFHHLFPLAHKYNGFMDLFGRRNLEDFNIQLTAQPLEKVKLLMWYHLFNLQDNDDIPYSVVMGQSPAGLAGFAPGGSQYLGQELDLVATWLINPRMNLLFGYSHFWAGSFFSTNGTPGLFNGDADFFYTQFTFNF